MPMLASRKMPRSAILMVFLAAALAGCGIKGPPVPPDRTPPPSVADLQAVVEGETIRMSWTVKRSTAQGPSALEGFHVFRWQNPVEEPACPGCPKVFERIADVELESGSPAEGDRLSFSFEAELPTGYRYTFKVIGYSRDGMKSGDSNVLDSEY